ncbi:MFS transporter, partial [Anaerolinea sp.]|uniref:MFS transporter n=1 Tax=Anaerolinea sp. TaxID=1872519 RepID=UPI002ACE4FB5
MPTNILLVAISLFFWGIGEGLFSYFQPVYLQQLGASSVKIGVIYGALGIAMTIAQAPAGFLADKIGNRPVMWASWVLGSASAIVMAFAMTEDVFIAGMLLYGLTSFVIAPMNAYITSVRENWSIERALTTTAIAFNLGMILGPKLGGIIATASGIKSIYQYSAGLFIISTLIILFAKKPSETETHPETQKSPKLIANR